MYINVWFVNCIGLAPRAALVVQRTDQQGVLTQGEGPGKVMSMLAHSLAVLQGSKLSMFCEQDTPSPRPYLMLNRKPRGNRQELTRAGRTFHHWVQ